MAVSVGVRPDWSRALGAGLLDRCRKAFSDDQLQSKNLQALKAEYGTVSGGLGCHPPMSYRSVLLQMSLWGVCGVNM